MARSVGNNITFDQEIHYFVAEMNSPGVGVMDGTVLDVGVA